NWICRKSSRHRRNARPHRKLQAKTKHPRGHPWRSIEQIEEDDQEGQRAEETMSVPQTSGRQLQQCGVVISK
ncbi:hypothetical protein F444_23048, partial [Phytophthora nicotianae P1976]